MEIFFGWLQYKLNRRDKKYVEAGLKSLYTRMKNLSCGDPEIARQIVEQSYANNWAGIFELKERKHAATQTTQRDRQDDGHPTDSELHQQSIGIIERLRAERHARNAEVRK